MGKGTFGGGEIELHVSIEEDADQAVIDRWKESFEEASRMLFRATGGAARFAKVYLYTAGAGVTDADAHLDRTESGSWTGAHPTILPEDPPDLSAMGPNITLLDGFVCEDLVPDAERFDEGTCMTLGLDAFDRPFTVLHEFGHYGFGLGDEYRGEQATQCTTNQRKSALPRTLYDLGDLNESEKKQVLQALHACIMGPRTIDLNVTRFVDAANEKGYEMLNGWIVEFCKAGNHDSTNGSLHNTNNQNRSCEELIQERRGIAVAEVPLTDTTLNTPLGTGGTDTKWPQTSNGVVVGVSCDDSIDGAIEGGEYPAIFASSTDRTLLLKFGSARERDGFESMPGGNAALASLIDRVGTDGVRAAEQAVLLFSTGREPILHAGRLAKRFVGRGVRVFAVGLGTDRAALQQLAQRTGGAYLEVDANGEPPGRGRTSQLVRHYMASAYDRLRLGFPARVVSREELVEKKDGVDILVEKGSKLLKLVVAQTPRPGATISARPPGEGARELELIESDQGGFRILSVPDPMPGMWCVKLEGDLVPDALALSAYSANPRISVGVTGWRRLRLAGEKVTLQIVVRTPFVVVDLDIAVVRVTPPSGADMQEHPLEPRQDGVHVAQFEVTSPGAYGVEVLIRNDGHAVAAGDFSESEPAPPVPLFERVAWFQIHVAAPM